MSKLEKYDPSKLMDKFVGVESKPQQLGPLGQEATALNGLFEQYRQVLESTKLDGEKVIATPPVEFTDPVSKAKASAFFLRPSQFKRTEPKRISSCITVDSAEVAASQPEKFYLYVDSGNAEGADISGDFTNSALLREAINATSRALSNRQRALEEVNAGRVERRKRAGKYAAWVAALGCVGFGADYGVTSWVNSAHRAAAHAKERRVKFDNSGYEIPGPLSPMSTISVSDVAPEQFSQIPSYHKGDSLLSARRFKLNEQSCKTFSTVVKVGEKVVIATSKTDDMQGQPIIAGRDNRGDLAICSTHGYPGRFKSWSLAVQVEE